jgi:hypothetical protein
MLAPLTALQGLGRTTKIRERGEEGRGANAGRRSAAGPSGKDSSDTNHVVSSPRTPELNLSPLISSPLLCSLWLGCRLSERLLLHLADIIMQSACEPV